MTPQRLKVEISAREKKQDQTRPKRSGALSKIRYGSFAVMCLCIWLSSSNSNTDVAAWSIIVGGVGLLVWLFAIFGSDAG